MFTLRRVVPEATFKILLVALALLLGACQSTPTPSEELADLIFPGPPDEPRLVWERVLRGSTDVDGTEDESSALQALITGTQAVSGRGFTKPFGVAAHQGRVYVGDTVSRTVMMLDPANSTFKEIGRDDPGRLAKPLGLETDAAGNLYVMDATSKWVVVYDRDGNFLRGIGGKEFFERPSAVAVTPDGSKVFVVDTGSSRGGVDNHRVRVFDGESGAHLYDIGQRGEEEGQLNLARDAEIGPDGNLYVVDGGNFRVQVFTQEGQFVRAFGSVGRRLGQMARPKGIGISPDGNVYISDASHANFQIFDSKGQLLLFVGGRGKMNTRATYILPAMIDVDEDGRVYIVDQVYQKVEVYRPAALKKEEGALGLAFEKMKAATVGKK